MEFKDGNFGEWIKTKDAIPKKPGKERYEQIHCLVVRNGYIQHLVWNCEHVCWDDAEGDDYVCNADAVTHWMPFPDLPAKG